MDEKNGPGSIPNRWLKCPRKSTDLIVSKFIAFKTPLSEKFDPQVPVGCRFPPKMLFQLYHTKKVKIGLWIDLTNTSRFYSSKEIEKTGCEYKKLQCRGHGETPSSELTKSFISLCHNFIIHNPLEVVAVHCTHGFNRSGFLIVSYLVEKMDCDLNMALSEFSRARPPGIYKQDYLEVLYQRYGEIEDTPLAPNLPDWCFEEENTFDRDDGSLAESSSSESGTSRENSGNTHKKFKGKVPVFMAGVPGVTLFTQQPKLYGLQKKVQSMCGWKSPKDFPGCQPVSMDLQNLELLGQKPYRVSWKADGMRYMMLINGEKEVYFFDRDNNVFIVEGIRFPHRKDFDKHLTNTLLDGEMVIDKVQNEEIPRYLAYDIINFEGQDVGKLPFYPVRLRCIQDEIIMPRNLAIREGRINRTEEPFSVRSKDFWDVTQAVNLLGDKFSKQLSHEPDGLIFQPSKEPYKPGACEEVLKWKPLSLNSVDFRLKIVKEQGVGLVTTKVGHLFVGQLTPCFAKIKLTKDLRELDNKIIECKFENNEWIFMRERTDKSFPNSFDTATAVCKSIIKPVTKEHLLEYIAYNKYIEDIEVMPPPSKKLRR